MGDRCTGNCCEEFTISLGPTVEVILDRLRNENRIDGAYIADMLVPLRALTVGARKVSSVDLVTEEDVRDAPGGCWGWAFTCRHFDTTNRVCTAYEDRPQMCRDFPYGKKCPYGDSCEWDKGRDIGYPPKWYKRSYPTPIDGVRGKPTLHLHVINQRDSVAAPLCTKHILSIIDAPELTDHLQVAKREITEQPSP